MTQDGDSLLHLCGGDRKLYNVTKLLDHYDFGGTGSNEPGEYIVEGREFVQWYYRIGNPSTREVVKFIATLHKVKFSLLMSPMFKYRKIANELVRAMENSSDNQASEAHS